MELNKLKKLTITSWWHQKYCHLLLRFAQDSPLDLDQIDGYLSKLEARFLFNLSKKLDPGSIIVEIGSFKGKSTSMLLSGVIGREIKVHAIDTWMNTAAPYDAPEDVYPEFSRNIEAFLDAVVIHKGRSEEIARSWDRKIDLLFIDGDHSYEGASKDILGWLPHVKPGGWVVFHDSGTPGVSKAIKEHFPRARRAGMPFYAWSIFAQRVKQASKIFL